jgi:hypothetical protein
VKFCATLDLLIIIIIIILKALPLQVSLEALSGFINIVHVWLFAFLSYIVGGLEIFVFYCMQSSLIDPEIDTCRN